MPCSPGMELILAQIARDFSQPIEPTEMTISVALLAQERIESFAAIMSDLIDEEVTTGGVIEFAVDLLWSKWTGET